MGEDERLITSTKLDCDAGENSLRPKTLEEYIGQEKEKSKLKVYMEAAKLRGEPLDHVPVSYTHLDVYKRQVLLFLAF